MITAMANETQMSAPDISATVPDWSREQMRAAHGIPRARCCEASEIISEHMDRSLDCAANMPCFVTVFGR